MFNLVVYFSQGGTIGCTDYTVLLFVFKQVPLIWACVMPELCERAYPSSRSLVSLPIQPFFPCSSIVENAPLTARLLETPLCHVFCIRFRFSFWRRFSVARSFTVIFCNQELSRKSGCQVLQTNATTLGHAESLTPIFDLTLLGEFNFTVSFSVY